jgi:hypothetical protein
MNYSLTMAYTLVCSLRSSIWDVVIIQHLIRSLYNGTPQTQEGEKLTPTKKLAAALDAFELSSPGSSSSSASSKLKTALPAHIRPIFRQVTKARGTCQTSYTDEVQLVVDPSSLADEARQYLRYPDPNVGKLEKRKEAEWRQKLASGQDVGDGPAANRQLKCDDPDSEEKYWIPESLLRLAYPEIIQKWEDAMAEKADKKANKGKKKNTKKDAASSSSSPAKSPPKAKSTKSSSASPTKADAAKKSIKAKAPTKATAYSSSSDSEPPKKRAPSKAAPITYPDSDSEEGDLFSPKKLSASKSQARAPSMAASTSASSAWSYTATAKPKARDASAISSSESSDSDIEIVSKKSPKKSPRKSDTQQTARPPAVLPVKSFSTHTSRPQTSTVQEKAKARQFECWDLDDPTDDSNDEQLPGVPRSRKELSSQAMRRNLSSTSSSSYHSSGTRSASSTSTSSLLSHKSSKAASTQSAVTVPKRSGSANSEVIIIESDSDSDQA